MTWKEAFNDQGRVYFYDLKTRKTQWERPEGFKDEMVEKVLSEAGWETYTTDKGETYYFDRKTQKSVWEVPEELREKLKKVTSENTEKDGKSKKEEDQKTQDVIPKDGIKTINSDANKLIGLENLIKSDKQEDTLPVLSETDSAKQRDEYLSMLKEAKVDLTWSFAKIIDACVDDIRYWQISDPIQRKNLADEYLDKLEDEKEKKIEESREEYKKQFFAILTKYDGIKYFTRWNTGKELLRKEEICKKIPENMQESFFNVYIEDLRKKHDDEKRHKKAQALEKLNEQLLPAVKYNTKFQDLLQGLDMEKKHPELSKLDIITTFMSILKEKEDQFNKAVRDSERLNERDDRKARDGFKSLLKSLEDKNEIKIGPKLLWCDLLPHIKDTKEFKALCGHRGSSAIDFYWDILDRENQLIRAKRDLCIQMLAEMKIDVTSVQKDEVKFKEVLKGKFSDSELTLIFEQLKAMKPEASKRKHSDQTNTQRKRVKLQTLGYGSLR